VFLAPAPLPDALVLRGYSGMLEPQMQRQMAPALSAGKRATYHFVWCRYAISLSALWRPDDHQQLLARDTTLLQALHTQGATATLSQPAANGACCSR